MIADNSNFQLHGSFHELAPPNLPEAQQGEFHTAAFTDTAMMLIKSTSKHARSVASMHPTSVTLRSVSMPQPLIAPLDVRTHAPEEWSFDANTVCQPGTTKCPTKHVDRHCFNDRLAGASYTSWEAAKLACIAKGRECFGVYDEKCTGRASIYLCDAAKVETVTNLVKSVSGSCVFEKPLNDSAPYAVSILHLFWRPRASVFSIAWHAGTCLQQSRACQL